jgi:hypothetical protein
MVGGFRHLLKTLFKTGGWAFICIFMYVMCNVLEGWNYIDMYRIIIIIIQGCTDRMYFNRSSLSTAQSVYIKPNLQGLLWASGVSATGSKTEVIRTPLLGNSQLRYSRGLLFHITQ